MRGFSSKVEALLPLPLAMFHMLLSLSEGERHGYALKREIVQRTGGKLNLGSGALYGSINKMLEQGLIEESDERPDQHLDDERRRYYASLHLAVGWRKPRRFDCANWCGLLKRTCDFRSQHETQALPSRIGIPVVAEALSGGLPRGV